MRTFHALLLLGMGSLASTALPSLQTPAAVQLEALDGTRRTLGLEGLELPEWSPGSARLLFPTGPSSGGTRAPDGFRLELLNGDRVHGRVVGGSQEELRLEVLGKAQVSFPIDRFHSLLSAADLSRAGELGPPETGDRLWRRVGDGYDRIDGLLVGFAKTGLTFEGQLGEREYSWTEVAGLWIEAFASEPAPSGSRPRVAVDLADGTRLRGEYLGLSGGRLTLGTGPTVRVDLPLETLLEVDLDGAALRFVSELPFEDVGPGGLFGDEFGMRVPPRRDASVLGGMLSANGKRFAHGIGVPAPSRLAFDWSAGGTLRGAVAVDDSVRRTAAKGSVRFRIYLDGELAFESAELSSVGAAVELPGLSLAGKRRVELEVDAASDSVMGDRANWLDLRITQG